MNSSTHGRGLEELLTVDVAVARPFNPRFTW